MKTPKALFVIAFNGFRDEEYAEPKKILEENGISVETASTTVGQATGKLGMSTEVSCLYSEADLSQYYAVIFVGGPGSVAFWDDKEAHNLLQRAAERRLVVGGICSAAVTLAKAGLLRDRRATVFPGDADVFKPLVGQYTATDCERDGLFITANGPGAATRFGRRVLVAINELNI